MPSKGPEYESTQKLVNIALKSGMNQDEIAKLCRVNQSTVSRWKKGERRANQQQIKPLLLRFGERMGRPPFQLYQRKERRDPQLSASQLLKVDGRLILREAFVLDESYDPEAMRLSVQEVSRGRFALVLEYAHGKLPLKQGKGKAIDLRNRDMPWMLPKDRSVWVCDQDELIAISDRVAAQYKQKFPGFERVTLLLALALLNHGYNVEGLETLATETPSTDSA